MDKVVTAFVAALCGNKRGVVLQLRRWRRVPPPPGASPSEAGYPAGGSLRSCPRGEGEGRADLAVPRWPVALLCLFLFSPGRVLGDAGIATHKSDPSKDPNGMKAQTFFELLDASLGKKFNSLVLVFGGCFTSDFTAKAKTSMVGTSGKPVAVLAATDENAATQFAGGTQLGNTFTGGVNDKLGESGSTVEEAFDLGKNRVKRSDAKSPNPTGQNPTFTPLNGGGAIQPGVGASSYHAILFVGKPTNCADWNDLDKMYQTLRDRGYPAENIDCYFGRGERAKGGGDSTPVLSKDDFSAGNSVKQEAQDPSKCPGFTDHGETIQPATYDNLKKALEKLKTIADAGADEQYFLWFADHSTLLALGTPSSRPCDSTALCSLDVNVPAAYLTMPATDPMEVIVRPEGLISQHAVFLNGFPVGQLDPSRDGEFQFFPVSTNEVIPGLNTVGVQTMGASFTIDDVAITTGEVPIQFYRENPPSPVVLTATLATERGCGDTVQYRVGEQLNVTLRVDGADPVEATIEGVLADGRVVPLFQGQVPGNQTISMPLANIGTTLGRRVVRLQAQAGGVTSNVAECSFTVVGDQTPPPTQPPPPHT